MKKVIVLSLFLAGCGSRYNIPADALTYAEQACAPNQGLQWVRKHNFANTDIVAKCKNGIELNFDRTTKR